jgi:molecular chaperone HscB
MPASMDYFELLGIERRFAISDQKLMAAFRAMARRIHPDRFTGQTDEARALATRLSAQLNQAVEVLKSPLLRAGYMLDLAGGPGASEVRDVPGCLLSTIMILREEIEEARRADDSKQTERLRSTISASREETFLHLANRADQLTLANDNEKREFRKLINSVKYFDNLLEELVDDPLTAAPASAGNGNA